MVALSLGSFLWCAADAQVLNVKGHGEVEAINEAINGVRLAQPGVGQLNTLKEIFCTAHARFSTRHCRVEAGTHCGCDAF